jgi:hypothetical protein
VKFAKTVDANPCAAAEADIEITAHCGSPY